MGPLLLYLLHIFRTPFSKNASGGLFLLVQCTLHLVKVKHTANRLITILFNSNRLFFRVSGNRIMLALTKWLILMYFKRLYLNWRYGDCRYLFLKD